MGAISAYAKGAPVRLIGNEIISAGDLYWYVRPDSPIKTLADTNGKTIAYSTNGSSTHGGVSAFIKQYNLNAKLVATGGPPATLTAVMSNQIDVGWGAPPFGLDQIDEGKIRVIATGDDTHVFRGQTVRVMLTTAKTLQAKKPLIDRFLKGYREPIDWLYSNPEALKVYADFNNISEARAKNIRDRFFKKQVLDPDKIVGLDVILPDAVAFKYIQAPLTKEQIAESSIQIPAALTAAYIRQRPFSCAMTASL